MLHPSQETLDHSNSSAVGGGNFSPCAHVFNAWTPLRETSYRPQADNTFPSDERTNNAGAPVRETSYSLFRYRITRREIYQKVESTP